MAYNQFTCDSSGAITGWGENCSPDISAYAKVFLTDYDFTFTTQTLANTLSQWQSDISDKNIYPLPMVSEMDNNSEGATKYTSPITGAQIVTRKGKQAETYRMVFDPCLNNRLQAFDGKKCRMILVDNNDNVIGTTPDGTIFKGFAIERFDMENWITSDGTNPAFIQFSVSYEYNSEREAELATFKAGFNIKSLNGIIPASLTEVGTSNATTVIVDVVTACDGVGISGLEVGDFIFLQDSDGLEETINTATESTTIPGRYTLAATAFETGTVNLRDVVNVGSSYYQGTAIAITIA